MVADRRDVHFKQAIHSAGDDEFCAGCEKGEVDMKESRKISPVEHKG